MAGFVTDLAKILDGDNGPAKLLTCVPHSAQAEFINFQGSQKTIS